MSLLNCPDCTQKMSKNAVACTQCGFQVTREYLETLLTLHAPIKLATKVIVGFVMLVAISTLSYFYISLHDQSRMYGTINPERFAQIQQAFDPKAGGIHKQLYSLVEQSVYNPGFLQHIETGYWDNGDFIVIHMIFKAENQYGQIFEQKVLAEATINGDIWKIISPCPTNEEDQGTCVRLKFFSQSMVASVMNSLYEFNSK